MKIVIKQFATLLLSSLLIATTPYMLYRPNGNSSANTISTKQTPPQINPSGPAIGTLGMVSSAHPLATRAGLDILAAGGNAFDAAVAIAATLNVVEPMMSGIGGYGTIIVYDAKRRQPWFLNCSGRIPRAVNSDQFRTPTPNYLQNRQGAKAVSTPGNVNAWEALSKRFGKLKWARLFQTSIKLADEGFTISEHTANLIRPAFTSFPPHAKRIFGNSGKPLEAGEELVQKDLARSLRLIADRGADVVHGGELGKAIESTMREADGFLSLRDLKENSAEWYQPISINYRGHEIVTASPPANAFDMLVRLGIMSRYDVTQLGHNSGKFLHLFAEVTKHAFWVRLNYAGDPEVKPPPLKVLLSETYWTSESSKINAERAKPFELPSNSMQSNNTTHFVVADRWGNVVSATQTLGNLFGSRIMPEGTGIWLNNSLAYSTFEPRGNPMDAFAGRHKLSGDCPTLVMRNGKPWIAIGTPGGHSIGQTVPQMIMNLIDFGMDIQQAITEPRISFVEPDLLAIEEQIQLEIRRDLEKVGHTTHPVKAIGNAHGLTIEYDSRGRPLRFKGGADPRGEGVAIGLAPSKPPTSTYSLTRR